MAIAIDEVRALAPTLEEYCAKWKLRDPVEIATTPTSYVYRVGCFDEDGYAVLKMLTPLGVLDEGAGGRALEYFGGRGAVRLLRHDRFAHLLEWIDGSALVSRLENATSKNDEEATNIIAVTLNQLHDVPEEIPAGLPSLRDRFRSLRARSEKDTNQGITSIYQDGAAVAEKLLASPTQLRVLHGDIHHGNIVFSEKRGWLAIDPKGLVGERTFDAANALLNPVSLAELVANPDRFHRTSEILSTQMRLSRERLCEFVFAYACLSASWACEDGEDPWLALAVAELAQRAV